MNRFVRLLRSLRSRARGSMCLYAPHRKRTLLPCARVSGSRGGFDVSDRLERGRVGGHKDVAGGKKLTLLCLAQHPLRLGRIARHSELAVIVKRLFQQLRGSGAVTGTVPVEQHPGAQAAQLGLF